MLTESIRTRMTQLAEKAKKPSKNDLECQNCGTEVDSPDELEKGWCKDCRNKWDKASPAERKRWVAGD